MSTNESENVTMAVSVKLAPFWIENPRLWFAQAESQFATRGVSVSLTKYHYVVASLTMEAAGRVMGLVEAVPRGGDPYAVLKDALLSAFSLSDYQRAEAIYSLPPLGDRRPSQLLAQIKSLMPSKHTDCLFIRHAFLSRLPEQVRTTVLRESGSLDDVAQLADTLVAAISACAVSEVVAPPEEFLDAVSRRVFQPRDQKRKGNEDLPMMKLCWYHRNFGSRANSCKGTREEPCRWTSGAAPASGNGRAGGRN